MTIDAFESDRPRVYGRGRSHFRSQRAMRRRFPKTPNRIALDVVVAAAISRTLYGYRIAAGKTQVQVAAETGIGDKTLSTFETGSRIAGITLAQINRLLTFYGIGFDRFLQDINRSER